MIQEKKMPVAATTGKNGTAANGRNLHAHDTTPRPNRQAPIANRQAMLAHALRYATNCGWPVLPVRGKDPATDHGHKDATTDPETIGALFAAAHGVTGVGARMGGALHRGEYGRWCREIRFAHAKADNVDTRALKIVGLFHQLHGVEGCGFTGACG